MSDLRHPTNDDDRLAFLRQAAARAQKDIDAGQYLLRQSSLRDLQNLANQFEGVLRDVRQRQQLRRPRIKEANEAVQALRKVLYNVWDRLRRQVQWGEIDQWVVKYYGLDHQARIPRTNKREDWLIMGANVLLGDEDAQNAGYAGMAERDALSEALERARVAVGALATAKVELAEARVQLVELRKACNRLCQHTVAELRLSLRGETPTLQRHVLRAYGVEFTPSASEEVESDAEEGTLSEVTTEPEVRGVIYESTAKPWPATTNGYEPLTNGHDVS